MKNNLCLKVIALVVCLSCLLFSAACNSTVELLDDSNNSSTINEGNTAANQDKNNSESPTTNQTDESSQTDESNMNSSSHVQPVPPIQMGSIDEILSVLKSSDTQNYREEFQTKYSELFAVLKNAGFIYNVDTSETTTTEDAVTFLVKDGKNLFFLMPYAQYEDAGIVSYVIFRGVVYQVCVYTADSGVLAQAETISEYIEMRLGRDVLNEVISEENVICFMADGNTAVNQKNYAASFIDDNHYFVISAEVSQDNLNTFLDVVNFEKTFIE